MILSEKDILRFWSKVAVLGPDDCWEWTAGKTKSGYGVFSVKSKWVAAHQVSFLIANGYVPNIKANQLIMHDCENPGCQNPKHLIEGDQMKNGNYPGCISKLKARTGPLSYWWGKTGQKSPRFGKKLTESS